MKRRDYGEQLGLKGKVATHWALNPHPTLIPAIESGWVEQIHSFGGEVGMEDYISARSDVYFTGHDGTLRSNRLICQTAGLYACDMFIGSTLQIDLAGNSSTVTPGRIAGFGGAPNMGSDPHGRRHISPAWLKAGREAADGEFTHVMVRLKTAELDIVDTLIAAGIANNRAEAIRWALTRVRERPAYEQLREHTRNIERLKSQF